MMYADGALALSAPHRNCVGSSTRNKGFWWTRATIQRRSG